MKSREEVEESIKAHVIKEKQNLMEAKEQLENGLEFVVLHGQDAYWRGLDITQMSLEQINRALDKSNDIEKNMDEYVKDTIVTVAHNSVSKVQRISDFTIRLILDDDEYKQFIKGERQLDDEVERDNVIQEIYEYYGYEGDFKERNNNKNKNSKILEFYNKAKEKMKGSFNKILNKLGLKKEMLLLGSGKVGPIIKSGIPEKEQLQSNEKSELGVNEMSDRDKFAKELQDHATRFDPSLMTQEEAIMKILEQQGLNPEFAKNPAAVNSISRKINGILGNAHIFKITAENLEEVKNILEEKTNQQNTKEGKGITITKDGNLIFTDNHTIPDNLLGMPSKNPIQKNETSIYSIEGLEDKRFSERNIVTTEENSTEDKDVKQITKNEYLSTFNKFGVEISSYKNVREERQENGKQAVPIYQQSWQAKRNEDLVTATYQENPPNYFR